MRTHKEDPMTIFMMEPYFKMHPLIEFFYKNNYRHDE
jgi:hypothetical protein